MNISVLTVFDNLYDSFLSTSLVRRAQENKVIAVDVVRFAAFVAPKERIDAPLYGPSSGMLIKPDVIQKAIEQQEASHGQAIKIFFCPQGTKLSQRLLREIYEKSVAGSKHVMLVASRYEGIDERVYEEYADYRVSLGDFVLMGGDLPAMVFIEGLIRLIPGVVGKQISVQQESFSTSTVDYPVYTEPVVWKNREVPSVVRSGNHAQIEAWRTQKAMEKTVKHHFRWLQTSLVTDEQKVVAYCHMPSHYVVLMHSQVLVGPEKKEGVSSVTSLDIHDIARACSTYGVKKFFLVTPLIDQQHIVEKLLDFWREGPGVEYNKNRHEAVKNVAVVSDIHEVIQAIEAIEGSKPVVVGTSARVVQHNRAVTFFDQEKVWATGRPVLVVLGTASGLSQEFLSACDYVLVPVQGLTLFNHLSVRSACAIILDRWIGLNPYTVDTGTQVRENR